MAKFIKMHQYTASNFLKKFQGMCSSKTCIVILGLQFFVSFLFCNMFPNLRFLYVEGDDAALLQPFDKSKKLKYGTKPSPAFRLTRELPCSVHTVISEFSFFPPICSVLCCWIQEALHGIVTPVGTHLTPLVLQ